MNETVVLDQLTEIIAYYVKIDGNPLKGRMGKIYGNIAGILSRLVDGGRWTWKYIRNVETGKMEPGKLLLKAIEIQYKMLHNMPTYKPAIACSCGDVHSYDCQYYMTVPKKQKVIYKPRSRYRPDIDPYITPEEKAFIADMTIDERTKRLLADFGSDHKETSPDLPGGGGSREEREPAKRS